MNVEGFDAPGAQPISALPAADSDALFDGPPALVRGPEPGEVVILIEADTFSGV